MNDQAQRPADESQATATLLAITRDLVAELRAGRTPAVTLDSSLSRDLGLDSLGRVELIARIERAFSIGLPDQVFASAETPRDLLRALGAAARAPAAKPPSIVEPASAAEEGVVPRGAQTLLDVLAVHVAAHGDRVHIELYDDTGEPDTLTYGELDRGARAVAAGLSALGMKPGDPVGIMLPTGRAYFFSFFGALIAGGIPVALYPPVRMTQLEDHLQRQGGILRNCRAPILITMPEARALARLLRAQVESLQHVVTPEEVFARGATSGGGATVNAQDIAFLQYTSGSTGNPKGVVLTHANLLANIRAMGDAVNAGPTDVFVSWLPLYHDMGLIGAWLGTLYFGAKLVIMSPLAFIARPVRWLHAIHRYRATLSAAPNFAYELCLKRIVDEDMAGIDLSAWRASFNGAEPVSADTIERFIARFEKFGFRREAMMPVYGLAECAVGLAFPPLDRGPLVDRIQRDAFMRNGNALPADANDARALRMVACGRPLAGHEIRIVDAMGRELPDRREGRLQFRGPSATSGYYRNPDETRRLFQDGWLESGDLAYTVDSDIYISGRSKDIIIRGGRNIYPQELEEAIGNIPGVRKGGVAVFGSEDRASGTQRLVVLAETREQNPATLDRIRGQINALASDLVAGPPDDVVLAPPRTVPKTSSGKIRRAASREVYEQGRIGQRQRGLRVQILRLALAGLVPELRRMAHAIGAFAYAAYAWTLYAVFALVVWLSVVLLPSASLRWRLMRDAGRLYVRLTGIGLDVEGEGNLPAGPCIVVANHTSYIDSYVLATVLPRRLSFVAKEELHRDPLSRLFLDRLETEYVRRFDTHGGAADVERIAGVARAGRTLLFYPEGTFTRAPGLLPFHLGAFVTAVASDLPVVPVAVRGARFVFRAESWFPRRGVIRVTVGTPIDTKAIKAEARDAWAAALRLRDRARADILRLSGEPDLARN